MQQPMTGACLCGALRYEARAEPQTVYYCHCRDCQVRSGSAFQVGVNVDRRAVRILSGEVKAYTKVADSGHKITRAFCPECGTPLFWTLERFPDIVILAAGGLDNPESVKPMFQIWTASALSWSRIEDGIESFPRGV